VADALPKLSEIRGMHAGCVTNYCPVAPLLAAVDAVLAVHTPWVMPAADAQPERVMCECSDHTLYPCQTRRAFANHINLED
jgi:hypothetical protein